MSRIAAIQMASGPKVGANLLEAERLIARAAKSGAGLMILPENFALMGLSEMDKVKQRETDGEGRIQDFLAAQAKRHGVWLVGGTIPLACDAPDKVRAACLVFDDAGRRVARFDKMHLFDVHIVETGEEYAESETIEPGDAVTVIDTPFGRMGLAVCYDLRFPELFRVMTEQGVDLVAVPSAFTEITGKAHWETLIRARAVENLCYVAAAAQGGFHANGRRTYGHSMIVDPWGVVLDELPSGAGFVQADIDRQRLASTRRTFPALDHRRMRCSLA